MIKQILLIGLLVVMAGSKLKHSADLLTLEVVSITQMTFPIFLSHTKSQNRSSQSRVIEASKLQSSQIAAQLSQVVIHD